MLKTLLPYFKKESADLTEGISRLREPFVPKDRSYTLLDVPFVPKKAYTATEKGSEVSKRLNGYCRYYLTEIEQYPFKILPVLGTNKAFREQLEQIYSTLCQLHPKLALNCVETPFKWVQTIGNTQKYGRFMRESYTQQLLETGADYLAYLEIEKISIKQVIQENETLLNLLDHVLQQIESLIQFPDEIAYVKMEELYPYLKDWDLY